MLLSFERVQMWGICPCLAPVVCIDPITPCVLWFARSWDMKTKQDRDTSSVTRTLSPVHTNGTLLANNSQHCWMLHVASVCKRC